MKSDKSNPASGMSTRQKATVGIFVVVIIVIVWQVIGLMRGSGGEAQIEPVASTTGAQPAMPGAPNMSAAMVAPKPEVAPKQNLSETDIAVLRQQQVAEGRYIEALNELQVLRVSKEIAETNQAIAKAKLETVTAQKDIVTLLAPAQVPTSSYAQALTNTSGQQPVPTQVPPPNAPSSTNPQEVSYTVISVSQLQNKWSAVVGFQGSLYQVSVGDVLPADQSTVISIDNSGITIEKSGVKRKISLVSII